MEKYWTSIIRKLIPELTRDTCYLVSLYLNISDIYLLIETLHIPICWPINILGIACFYDNLELLKVAMSKGYVPTQDISNAMRFCPNHEIYVSYIAKPDSRVNEFLKPLQVYTPHFQKNNSNILSIYKLENIPVDEMRHVSNLSFEDVKKLRPECVSLYFNFNSYFYDLTSDDWKWIYETCKNMQYFKTYLYTPISYDGALEAFKLGFVFTEYLYSWPNTILCNKKGESIMQIPDEEFLEFLVKHVPLTYENSSIYNVIQNLWAFKRVHMKIKIWKRKCLEIAFENSCQETIEILHSKGLKTTKACIIKALYHGNIRALEYEKKYIARRFQPLDLLKYVYFPHTVTWVLDNFPIQPRSFQRNNNMSKEALSELQHIGFTVTIKVPQVK